MPKFRNISGDDRFVDTPGRGLVLVEADAIVDIPEDPDRYIQVGDQGEPALFEAVEPAKSTTSPEKGE